MAWWRDRKEDCSDDAVCAYKGSDGKLYESKEERDRADKVRHYSSLTKRLEVLLTTPRQELVYLDGELTTHLDTVAHRMSFKRREQYLDDKHMKRLDAKYVSERIFQSLDDFIKLLQEIKEVRDAGPYN